MPSLDVAINALKAKQGAREFDEATKKVKRGAKDVDTSIGKNDKSFNQLGGTIKKIGVSLIGLAAAYKIGRFVQASVKEMADFEMELANVSTMLDDQSMKYLPGYEKALSNLAVKYGEATGSLSKGLYDILSASIDAADAIGVLEAATIAAKAGITDTGIAADVLTTIINAYGYVAEDATSISDILFATVKRGKTTFEELASTMGRVVSLAATAGLSLEEVAAALATMTRAGISTDIAMTSLRAMLVTFLSPTEQNIVAAKELGLELNSNTLRSIGLTGAVQAMSGATAEQVSAIFSNTRALTGLAALLQATEGHMFDLGEVTDSTGKTLEAFEKIADTTETKLNRMTEAWKEMKRTVGDEAKPAIDNFADTLVTLTPILGATLEVIGEIPDAIAQAYAKLETFDPLGMVLDPEGTKKRIAAAQSIVDSLDHESEAVKRLNQAVVEYQKLLGDQTYGVASAAEIFDVFADSALNAENSITNLFVPSEELTAALEKLKKGTDEAQQEIDNFGKTDIEKQIDQFRRLGESLTSADQREYRKFIEALGDMRDKLIELNALEVKAADRKAAKQKLEEETEARARAREEIGSLIREVQLEQELLCLTNDERERAIKLARLEAIAKKELSGESTVLVEEYKQELEKLQDMRETKELVDVTVGGIKDMVNAPLEAILDETKDFGDIMEATLRSIGASILRTLYEQMITQQVTKFATSFLMSAFAAEKGAVFSDGSPQKFDRGGIINRPTIFPMANGGVGLAGEAGKEAIMPLGRDEQGRLGVRAEGGGGGEQSVNIINVLDDSMVEEYLSTGAGERAVINIMRRNKNLIQEDMS